MSLQRSLQPRPAPVYVLLHAAEPLRREARDQVFEACAASMGLPAFNHGVYRAGEQGLDALAAARTLPMMADLRVVEVREVEEGGNGFFDALLEYLRDPSPSTVLILQGSGYPKVVKGTKRWSTPVEKAVLGAEGFVFDRKARLDPARFAEERARSQGKRFERGATRALIEAVGEDAGRLEREIDKLVLYVGDADAIRAEDVAAVCALVAEAVIWDLTSALVQRDRTKSLTHLQHLMEDGLDPRHLLMTITWKLRGVVGAAEAIRAGANDGQAAKAAGIRAFEVKTIRRAVENGMPMPAEILERLAVANREMNSHRAGAHRILERVVLDWVM